MIHSNETKTRIIIAALRVTASVPTVHAQHAPSGIQCVVETRLQKVFPRSMDERTPNSYRRALKTIPD